MELIMVWLLKIIGLFDSIFFKDYTYDRKSNV